MLCKYVMAACLLAFQTQAEARDQLVIHPVIPGTNTPDRSETPFVVEGDQVYKAIPGTWVPDRSGPSWTVRDGLIRNNIKGTSVPRRDIR
jgi:hypothetical protein